MPYNPNSEEVHFGEWAQETADAIHHLGAAYMRRVDVAIDVKFQRGIDTNNTKATY